MPIICPNKWALSGNWLLQSRRSAWHMKHALQKKSLGLHVYYSWLSRLHLHHTFKCVFLNAGTATTAVLLQHAVSACAIAVPSSPSNTTMSIKLYRTHHIRKLQADRINQNTRQDTNKPQLFLPISCFDVTLAGRACQDSHN